MSIYGRKIESKEQLPNKAAQTCQLLFEFMMDQSFNIVYYCTGHGLGHLSRSLEIINRLINNGHLVTVVTGAPVQVLSKDLPSTGLTIRHSILDTGAKQKDAFTVDQRGSLEDYLAIAGEQSRDKIIEQEASWLAKINAELVVSDIVPLACVAAAKAGLPCVAVSNFSWDFIYSEYLTAAGISEFRRNVVWQIADDYASALKLLRLPGHVPMPAFREVLDVPLVVRHARKSREEVRRSLNISEDVKLVCFIYGGQPPGADWKLEESCLPLGWLCLVCSAGQPPTGSPLPANFILAPEDAYTPDLISASDVVLGKIGYGTTSECLAHEKPLVFLRRDFFNEEPFLRKLLELHDAAVEMKRKDFLSGNWTPYLERALALNPHYPALTNGAEVVAAELIQTARDFKHGGLQLPSNHISSPISSPVGNQGLRPGSAGSGSTPRHPGQSRLRDTIAWGYVMGRHASREFEDEEVPEWYTRGQIPFYNDQGAGIGSSSSMKASSGRPAAASKEEEEPETTTTVKDIEALFEIQQPPQTPLDQFPDTLRFLSLVGSLEEHGAMPAPAATPAAPPNSQESLESAKNLLVLPELRAAAGLFLENEPLIISRAPGRLDVMGGIADYSGSTVLQMPIQEAAHVALQLQSPRHQRLWRHMQARHASITFTDDNESKSASNPPSSPAIRIVSLNADATNRGPAFDMDLSELVTQEGEPISYAAAKAYFQRDPALSWAAYVAGGLVVLMREKGIKPQQGIAMLVSSEVPEGKGVSSSAAVEVASLISLASAHGVELEGRELALLCQKVENLVVGAPCGVMDQMASALGEADQLLALRCQPAEVQGPVQIPAHIRFWGVDSGIRHSVGGSDYGAVRVGAFMGLKILSSSLSSSSKNNNSSGQEETQSLELVGNGYLANTPPSVYSRKYERKLPSSLSGEEFLGKYGPHVDNATTVDPKKTYAVKVPTSHPIFENFRVLAFRQALAASVEGNIDLEHQMEVLGEIMLQSHASYSACGLGSEGTDRLVALVLEEKEAAERQGRLPALFGAKITGGGCGGTVCILGRADRQGAEAVRRVVQRYEEETGHSPQIFGGSSQGAQKFGVTIVKRRK